MRKLLGCLLILCLLAAGLAGAAAETTVTEHEVKVYKLELNEDTGTFLCQAERGGTYQVVDAQCNALSDKYGDMDIRDGFFRVSNENKTNRYGLLDGQGRMIIPMQYGDIKVQSERWQMAYVLKDATAENHDYETWGSGDSKQFFLIDTVDVYFDGNKIGTLDRMAVDGYPSAYGAYLQVKDREGNYKFYDSSFTAREGSYSEYDKDYRTGTITHVPSGQQAFVPGCTLTPEDVKTSVQEVKGKLVDLQGNELADVSGYYYVGTIEGGLVQVKSREDKYGLLDYSGNEILPCQYDSLGYDLEGAAKMGYIYAVKDDKGGFVSLTTGQETGFIYAKNAINQYAAFLSVDDLDGGKILLSAAGGKLDEKFSDVRCAYSYKQTSNLMAVVQTLDGNVGVIGQFGEYIIPADGTYNYAYRLSISNDGTLILGERDYGDYIIYTVHYELPESAPQPAGDGETWTCENGHEGNTGKFCTECGAPKPVEEAPAGDDGTWTCENGHAGNTGKFCTECGAPKPAEEDDGTWTCENGHEGNTGNFCTECGAPKPVK